MSWRKGDLNEVKMDTVVEQQPEGGWMRDAARGGSNLFRSGDLRQPSSG